ncbi:MAG: DUF5010 domain-containing protein [Proteobacteria bacterium]|nr:DUF5010 domain-containing protein [Pseudomonadota bacterium]
MQTVDTGKTIPPSNEETMEKPLKYFSLFLAITVWACCPLVASGGELPPPPGKHIPLDVQAVKEMHSFKSDQKIVATYYFYWYDIDSKTHIIDRDGTDALQDHPAKMDDFSFTLPSWHKGEILDMMAAGIDVVLPVYWGTPGGWENWSYEGLKHLSVALQELENEGKSPPAIGLFYDTTTLSFRTRFQPRKDGADLTTKSGKELFYCTIRDFFSLIPPRFWAQIDGKPLVWLYSSSWCSAFDQSTFDYLNERFKRDFQGKTPYVVREVSWSRPFRKGKGVPQPQGPVKTDNSYQWGAALGGMLAPLVRGVAAVGPGYNDSAVPGRTSPIRDRENGAFYEQSWLAALETKKNIIVIETWNELHEGTDICETKEYGRKYIELTARYVEHFKNGTIPPKLPGKYGEAKQVSVDFSTGKEICNGLKLVLWEDGLTEFCTKNKVSALRSKKNRLGGWRYIYFDVDRSFAFLKDEKFIVALQIAADRECEFMIQYDSNDDSATLDGAYKDTRLAKVQPYFSEVRFELPKARFSNRQNGGTDFRIAVVNSDVFVRRITLSRTK